MSARIRMARLAKIVTTLDVISQGHAVFGMGAGWFEPEHAGGDARMKGHGVSSPSMWS